MNDLSLGDVDARGVQLRPDIVWFGESIPRLDTAIGWVESADVILVVGTSLHVYPAASLMNYRRSGVACHYIDPNPAHIPHDIQVLAETASVGIPISVNRICGTLQ